MMKIWVDADACPVVIRELLFRASRRTGIELTLVANQPITVPSERHIKMLQVLRGFDAADDEIVKRVTAGDLVITSDLPLASEVIEKGGHVLTARGELLSKENIKARLNMRDFMETMRASGIQTQGPSALGQTERRAFANQLDKILQQNKC